MVLLSGMMRTAAMTGSTEPIEAWFAGRQTGRWAWQYARPAAPADTLRRIADLRERGVIDDAELEALRARLRV
jgi:hypothetical protein